MPWPLAYFLTWTTYGSHLHGDERGSVDFLHNKRGTDVLAPDARRRETIRDNLRWPEVLLSHQCRDVVDQAIEDHCRIRDWRIDALNVRSNHAHIVVDCRPSDAKSTLPHPDKVMAEFKYWGTRRLRDARLIAPVGRTWTDHGSTRWLNHQAGHAAAVTYVNEYQDDPDRFEYERRLRVFLEHLNRLDEEWRRLRSADEPSAQAEE